MSVDAGLLEEKIGYCFQDKKLLLSALTHPSYSSGNNYERLEFLGDAVIELCVSRYLYATNPDAPEGLLTKMRSEIVCSGALAAVANKIGLGSYLLLGKGEEATDGRKKRSILENAMEALIGAVFLDSDFLCVCGIIEKMIIHNTRGDSNDYKSRLQEFMQAKGEIKPNYETYRTEGPPHNSFFYVRLCIGDSEISLGKGKSKKEAEQDAAKNALTILK